jgi:hypothetical protein
MIVHMSRGQAAERVVTAAAVAAAAAAGVMVKRIAGVVCFQAAHVISVLVGQITR